MIDCTRTVKRWICVINGVAIDRGREIELGIKRPRQEGVVAHFNHETPRNPLHSK